MEKSLKKTNTGWKNSLIVFTVSILAKLFSLIRESVVASFAGATAQTDAYYIVASIFTILEAGLNTSIFNGFFPRYKSLTVDESQAERRKQFADVFFSYILLLSLALLLITAFLSKPIVAVMAPGFSSEYKLLTEKMLIISAPTVFIVICAECLSSILRAHDKFLVSQLREISYHLFAILLVVLCYRRFGVYALCLSLVAGAVGRFIIQYPTFSKIYRFRPRFDKNNRDAIDALKSLPPIILTTCITQVKAVVDKAMSSTLSAGSVSTLNYGQKLESAIGLIIPNALSMGYYPEFVDLYTKRDIDGLRNSIRRCMTVNFIFSIPLLAGSLFFRNEIVRIVFQRGSFTAGMASQTAMIFSAYMLGSLFYGISIIISNVFYCKGDVKTPMYVNLVDFILNVVLNLLLIKSFGATGLALATSISSFIVCVFRLVLIGRDIHFSLEGFKQIIKDVTKISLATVVSIIAGRYLGLSVFINPVVSFLVTVGITVIFYFVLILVLKPTGSDKISNRIFNKTV